MIAKRQFNIITHGDKITKKRDPFILVANHLNEWDNFVVMKNVNYKIRFLSTQIKFKQKVKKQRMGIFARFFLKLVGRLKVDETDKIFEYLKAGYAVGIFPEGAATFHGASLKVRKETGVLIKEANVDVVAVCQSGGYLSHPRWADNFAKFGVLHTRTSVIIKKEELADLTPLKINNIVARAIQNNDYEFQKEHMVRLDRVNRAEGIERILFYCNKCYSPMTVFGQGDDIYCYKCGKIGHINEYELIEGNDFDNLFDYHRYQYSKMEEVVESEFVFFATLSLVDIYSLRSMRIGNYKVRFKDKTLFFTDRISTYTFEVKKIKFPVITSNNTFRFDYGEETYNLSNILHPVVLYDLCRYLNKVTINEVKR